MRSMRRIGRTLADYTALAAIGAGLVAIFAALESKTKPAADAVPKPRLDDTAPREMQEKTITDGEGTQVVASGERTKTTQAAPPPAFLQSVMNSAPMLRWPIRFLWRISERWGSDNCVLMAAAMAFFGLLSLFPIILAALAIIGQVLADRPEMREKFLGFVKEMLPGSSGSIMANIKSVADAPQAAVGVFSILSLLWSGRAFFDTLSSVLNKIWWQAKERTFLQQQMVLWGTMFGAGAVWLLSTGVTFALSALRELSHQILGESGLFNIIGRFISWALTVLMFWMIYRFLPNAKPGHRGRLALGAALVAAIGWEGAKWAFTSYLGNATKYGAIYGSVAGVVLTLMWLYFSSSILLLGAQAAAAYEEVKDPEFPRTPVEANAVA